MAETTEQTAAREAAELKAFQALVGYAERYAYFHAHPSLANVYCVTNFSVAPNVPATVQKPQDTK